MDELIISSEVRDRVALPSPAGKAHPFKGGMKGGLAFFLKA